jgi:chromosome segregation ATPase
MQQILKRLEIIKTGITIEDMEIITLQLDKLNGMELDDEVRSIVEKIKDDDFAKVVADIEAYLDKFSGLVPYEDKEVIGLKLELKVLEGKLQALSERKTEYSNDIHEFNTQYSLVLGEVIGKILDLERQMLYMETIEKELAFNAVKDGYESCKDELEALKVQRDVLEEQLKEMDEFDDDYEEIYEALQTIKQQIDEKEQELYEKRQETKKAKEELDEDPVFREYEEAKNTYEEFNGEYEEVLNEERYTLSDEEALELKKLFRKAVKLCHPDIVSDELKSEAQAIIQELNNAYKKKDLSKVKEILFNLENNMSFTVSSDSVNNREILEVKIVDIRERINVIMQEINELQEDETFTAIHDIEDWDAYFQERKEQLDEKYTDLVEEYERRFGKSI